MTKPCREQADRDVLEDGLADTDGLVGSSPDAFDVVEVLAQ